MGFPRAERVLAGFSCALALTVSSGTLAAQPAGAASIYCCDVGGQPVALGSSAYFCGQGFGTGGGLFGLRPVAPA